MGRREATRHHRSQDRRSQACPRKFHEGNGWTKKISSAKVELKRRQAVDESPHCYQAPQRSPPTAHSKPPCAFLHTLNPRRCSHGRRPNEVGPLQGTNNERAAASSPLQTALSLINKLTYFTVLKGGAALAAPIKAPKTNWAFRPRREIMPGKLSKWLTVSMQK